MKPKTKFLKMYDKLPEKARTELSLRHGIRPYSLSIVRLEVTEDTKLGAKFLKRLGYEEKSGLLNHGKFIKGMCK